MEFIKITDKSMHNVVIKERTVDDDDEYFMLVNKVITRFKGRHIASIDNEGWDKVPYYTWEVVDIYKTDNDVLLVNESIHTKYGDGDTTVHNRIHNYIKTKDDIAGYLNIVFNRMNFEDRRNSIKNFVDKLEL